MELVGGYFYKKKSKTGRSKTGRRKTRGRSKRH